MRSIAIAGWGASVPPGDRALAGALEGLGWNVAQRVWSDVEVEWARYDAVVVRSCWDYHLRSSDFVEWIARLERTAVPIVNAASLIRWNMDKRYLAKMNVAIPETEWLGDGEICNVAEVCARRGWNAAVVKPLISASAYKTELRTEGFVRGPMMVQEFIPEVREDGELSLMFFGGVFSHAARKRPKRGDFRVQMEFGGTSEAVAPDASTIAFASDALAELPERPVLARVDIVVSEQRGPLLMELEAIEPELFFDCAPGSEEMAARAICA